MTTTAGFHCLYTDMALDREKLAREGGTLIDWHISRFRIMYARSPDGLNWEKPAMGIVHEGGHDTNIVFGSETYGNVWGPALLDDPLEQDPARRYKMLYERGAPGFRVSRRNARRPHPAGPFARRDPLDPS